MVVYLVYKEQRDLPVWYSLCTHSLMQLFSVQLRRAVQIRTAGVRKCRLLQIVLHGLVNIVERSNRHTPGVQGATGLRSLVKLVYTQPTKAVRKLLEEAVQIRTVGVHKYRSLQILRHDLFNMLEQSNGRTTGVQEATGLRSLAKLVYTQPTTAVPYQMEAALQIRTAGVQKYRSVQIVRHNLVNILELCNGRTPGV